jgi:hypothetical protein
MWEQIFQIALPAIMGAVTAAVPLYIQIRKLNVDLRASVEASQIEVARQAMELSNTATINKEGEWKRLLEEKDKELVRLRSKDDEQELKLGDLLTRHIECKQNEARQDERSKFFEKRSEEQGREIKALTTKILQLEKLIRERLNAPVEQSGSVTGEAI